MNMTDEVAIEILKNIKVILCAIYKDENLAKCNDALNKAIGSLQTPNIFHEFVFKATRTEIPPNATNGDVIKSMFNCTHIDKLDTCSFIDIYNCDNAMRVLNHWWNAPYKAESNSEMLVCPACGLDVHSHFKTCPRCGVKMESEDK